MLSKDAKVYLAARSEEKGKQAIERLKKTTGKTDIEYLYLDLADLKQIAQAAKEFMAREKQLHVLYLSAGVMYPKPGSKTEQGIELQYGVNTLGSHAFASALLPILRSTASQSPKNTVRVITTASSAAHYLAPKSGIELQKVQDEAYIKSGGMKSYTKYGASKFGNVLFANELAKRYGNEGIVSVSLDPGNINSDLWRTQGFFQKTLGRFVLHSVEQGAITQLYGGTSPDVTTKDGGCFLEPWARKSRCRHARTGDEALAEKQWQWCEEKIKENA